MSNYIGAPYTNLVSPNFVKEDFNGDGSTVDFTLTNEVPGGNEENLYVVLDNVVQEPTAAFSIEQNGSSEYKVLRFTEAPSSTAEIYVVHRGIGTINTAPAAGSVTAATLEAGLRSFTTDAFTAGSSQTDYIMSQQPIAIGSVIVTVDGIVQKATTNYTLVTTSTTNDTLRFTSAPDEDSEIEIKHLGILTTARRIADNQITTAMIQDGAITSAKLATGEDWGLVTGSLDSNLDFGSVS
jgi:hypothetical protein